MIDTVKMQRLIANMFGLQSTDLKLVKNGMPGKSSIIDSRISRLASLHYVH